MVIHKVCGDFNARFHRGNILIVMENWSIITQSTAMYLTAVSTEIRLA